MQGIPVTHTEPGADVQGQTTRASSTKGRWMHVLRRWPAALAIGLWVLFIRGAESDGMIREMAEVLLTLPLLYLIVAAVQRRRASWPVLVVLMVVLIALQTTDVVAPTVVFAAAAVALLVWGAIRGRLHRPGMFRLQALGMLGFGAVALAGLVVDPDAGRYLVAAGWFLHGVWDFAHIKLDKVVVPSYAEACGVIDVLIAAQLAFML